MDEAKHLLRELGEFASVRRQAHGEFFSKRALRAASAARAFLGFADFSAASVDLDALPAVG